MLQRLGVRRNKDSHVHGSVSSDEVPQTMDSVVVRIIFSFYTLSLRIVLQKSNTSAVNEQKGGKGKTNQSKSEVEGIILVGTRPRINVHKEHRAREYVIEVEESALSMVVIKRRRKPYKQKMKSGVIEKAGA